MASGDTLDVFMPDDCEPPSSNSANRALRNARPVLQFDASTDENAVFSRVLPLTYGGGGITITITWGAASATSGNVIWNTAIERTQEDTTDIDSDSFASAQSSGAVAAPSTSGQQSYDTTTHTNGAEMDSLAAGEAYRLKVTRDADNASDTMAGDAEILAIHIKET